MRYPRPGPAGRARRSLRRRSSRTGWTRRRRSPCRSSTMTVTFLPAGIASRRTWTNVAWSCTTSSWSGAAGRVGPGPSAFVVMGIHSPFGQFRDARSATHLLPRHGCTLGPRIRHPSRDALSGRKEHTVCQPRPSNGEEGSCVKLPVHVVIRRADVLRSLLRPDGAA
jgi:hypothetical protein